MSTDLKSIVSRSRGRAQKASSNGRKQFRFAEQQIGPFTIYFSAHHKQEKNAEGKQVWAPTGELSLKVEIGDSFPVVSLGWNHNGQGALATVANHLDDFGQAVEAALTLWADDETFQAAAAALDQHIAAARKQQAPARQQPQAGGPLASRVANRQQ